MLIDDRSNQTMSNSVKILLLEDSEDDTGLIFRELKRDGLLFSLKRVESREEYISAIASFQPDIILSDHALPQFNSIDAYKYYKEIDLQIPFILVTGTVSEEFAVNIIKQGVDDYIIKSNLSRLPSAIRNAISKRRAEQEKKEAQQNLLAQNDELVKINEELDSFVYSVSHNLRSPLLSVLGLINLLTSEVALDSTGANYVHLMKRSILQLDDTLKDILEYSRNSHEKLVITQIDFQNLVETSVEKFLHIKDIHSIKIDTKINGKLPFYSDSYRLSIILRNLISNSINYRDEKKSTSLLNVNATISEEQVVIELEDNGVGIDSELVPDIFKMFYRANEKSTGAGLGLYIVKEVVNRLGGKLELTSKVNIGTKVIVTLPNKLNAESS